MTARAAAGSLVFTLFALTAIPPAAAAAEAAIAAAGESSPPEIGPEDCALLDDAKARGKMDGLLLELLLACGRQDELGIGHTEIDRAAIPADGGVGAPDVLVNDPSGDSGASTTQSETSIVVNPATGTYCSGYNDSYHGVVQGQGFTGFSRSTDQGATWDDRGPLDSTSSGDPSLVWRQADGKFYFAALRQGGLGVWRSDDDCLSFTFVSQIVSGSDDKEIMAVDNNPGSPFFGRLYVAWTDFGSGSRIYSTYSDDGGASWSAQVPLSGVGIDVQGAWPAVAPNGTVYVGWVRWNPWVSSGDTTMDIEIARSSDGGDTWSLETNPLTGAQHPSDPAASSICGRPALNENIRYLPSPQLAVGTDGALHVVYSYDPDDYGSGDVVNVYYRKSTDQGASWGPEVRLNDDVTLMDQYYPTLSVSPENVVVTTFYDRRLDAPDNELQDTFKAVSADGGASWLPNERVSDVSSPIYIDPNLAACYHGDYDQITQEPGFALLQWSDDRNLFGGHNDPDVWFESAAVSTDFLLVADPRGLQICAPDDAVYTINVLQFQGFSEPVTLAASGHPAGTTASFSLNPVMPPGVSDLTISNTGAGAAGSYTVTVTGTSSPSSIVRSIDLGLDLFTATPSAPNLLSPPNGAPNQPPTVDLEWAPAAQASAYLVEVATDPVFTAIVDSATVTGTTYTTGPLATNTTHYWRVTAENPCGTATSVTFSFTIEPAPGDCGPGTVANQYFADDFESGAVGWTHSGSGDTWTLSGARTHSGASAYYAEDVTVVSDQYLVSPAIDLPADEAPLTLQFWNWQELEDRTGGCYDGSVIEISVDDGASWIRLESELLTDPYDGPVACCSNPLADENAWCGDPQDWLESVVDLEAFAGQTVRFRFRLGTDSSVGREGWYIDDVVVQSCVGDSVIFADGFESGDTSAWTEAVP